MTRVFWRDFNYPFARRASLLDLRFEHLTIRFRCDVLGRKIFRYLDRNLFRLRLLAALPVNKGRFDLERLRNCRLECENGRRLRWIRIVRLHRDRLHLLASAVASFYAGSDGSL